MSERKLIILGTASQVPARDRNQNGYFLRFDDEGFLFDPGENTQRQMILAGVSVTGITKIFISHFHGDHCLGLAGIIQRISLDRVKHVIEIYYPASGRRYFDNLRHACSYHDEAHLRECPVEREGIVFQDDRLIITAGRLDHDIDTFGYRVQEKDSYTLDPDMLRKTGIFGELAGELKRKGRVRIGPKIITVEDVGGVLSGQAFAFIMDSRPCKAIHDLARNADLVVMESTYLSDLEEKAMEFGHLTASQAGLIGSECRVGILVLSHYSQRYSSPDELAAEASQYHPRVIGARDGDNIELPRRKRVISSIDKS